MQPLQGCSELFISLPGVLRRAKLSNAFGVAHRLRASRAVRKASSESTPSTLAAAKFFKPPLSFSEPQRFSVWLDLIIERLNQALSKLHTISERELHRISRELIQI
jgi:hypothetical protein